MVAFYKHDIAHWIDGTSKLSDGEYRVYHLIVQLIYQMEGPIVLNERGFAGSCGQHLLRFRKNFERLLELKKLYLVDGKVYNERSALELAKIKKKRTSKTAHENLPKQPQTPRQPQPNPPSTPAQPQGNHHSYIGWSDGGLADNSLIFNTSNESQGGPREEKRREEKRERAPPLTRAAKLATRGTRIPPDWSLTEPSVAFAKSRGLNEREIQLAHEKFVRYWKNAPGQKGLKLDWQMTWETWCIREGERLGRTPVKPGGNGSNGSGSPQSFTLEIWRKILRAFEMTNNWNPEHGPAPGARGCLVPPELTDPKLF